MLTGKLMAYRNRTIPETDAGVRRFVYSFSRSIALDPARYRLTQADADLLVAEADALIEASITASRPRTRTRPSIQRRDTIHKRVVGVFRTYVPKLRANPALSAEELKKLGIVIAQRRKSPIPAPTASPGLLVSLDEQRGHKIFYKTTAGAHSHRKPRGATHLVLLCHLEDGPAGVPSGDPSTALYIGAFTRTPIRVRHKPEDTGKMATYSAAWLMSTGEQSPWFRSTPEQVIGWTMGPMKLAA